MRNTGFRSRYPWDHGFKSDPLNSGLYGRAANAATQPGVQDVSTVEEMIRRSGVARANWYPERWTPKTEQRRILAPPPAVVDPEVAQRVAQQIFQLQRSQGWAQDQCAKRLNVSVGVLWRIQHNRIMPHEVSAVTAKLATL